MFWTKPTRRRRMDVRDIRLDDRETPRDLHWRRHPERQERVEASESSHTEYQPVRGLEAAARRWGTCAGCGEVGELIPDPLTPGCEWCDRCSE
jgi:hypothetical protein